MNLEDYLKIGSCGAGGMLLGEAAFLAVNGVPPFANGFSLRECFEVALRDGNVFYYALGGITAGVLAGMWYYDKYPKWMDSRRNNKDGY